MAREKRQVRAWCMFCKAEVELAEYEVAPRFGGGRCAWGACPRCGGRVCKALRAARRKT